MRILNVHERALAATPDQVGALLATLGSDGDRLWPWQDWPRMKLRDGPRVGSAGGHGPIRYVVEAVDPGRRIVFRFTRPHGWSGTHAFSVTAKSERRTTLRHALRMEATGRGSLAWAIIFRPLHDALIEDALARAAAEVGETDVLPPRHSLYVRLLRRLMRRPRGRARLGRGRTGARESAVSKAARWRFNRFPAYRRTGAQVTFIAGDWAEIRIRLPLDRRTRNYVGTMFGGSMYAAVDPVYMMMLIRRLGPEFIVWDRSAEIRFRRPGRDTLFASFSVDDDEVDEIRSILGREASVDRTYQTALVDRLGQVHALVEKTIHIRRRGARDESSGNGTDGEVPGR